MIYDKKTLEKCSIEQLKKFEKEHKEELKRFVDEWLAIDHEKNYSFARDIKDYDFKVQSCSQRLLNIQLVLKSKFEKE
jgi:hypothetical protein